MGPKFILGVDGGGSYTRARLANVHGEALGSGAAGSSNPQGVGMAAAQAQILAAIQRAFEDAGMSQERVAAACLGLAGTDRPTERADLEEWARRAIAVRVRVINDGETVLAAGNPDGWGVALIAGTGSSAWARSREGSLTRAGGWGYLIGDEGSGFDLARAGLRAVSRAADGRGQSTLLLPAILRHWNLSSPMDLVQLVYRSGLKPADIAALAPLIVQAAEQGDAVARGLVDDAGHALAEMVMAVARSAGIIDEEIPLALAGGLLLKADLVRARLLERLEATDRRFKPVELVREPVVGAIRLAQQLISSVDESTPA